MKRLWILWLLSAPLFGQTVTQNLTWAASSSQSATSCLTCSPPTGPTLVNVYDLANPPGGVCPPFSKVYTQVTTTAPPSATSASPYTLAGLPGNSTVCVVITAYFTANGPTAEGGPSGVLTFQSKAPAPAVPAAPGTPALTN